MIKNKEVTKTKIFEALEQIISEGGVSAAGINNTAKTAGVDKVLIYRYFGGFNELLKEFIIQKDFFVNFIIDEALLKKITDNETKVEFLKSVLLNQYNYIKNNVIFANILIWELSTKNEITEYIAKERERVGLKNLEILSKYFKIDKNINAIISLLISGIYYLALRSKTVEVFNGIKLNEVAGIKELEQGIDMLLKLIVNNIKI
ncbi:MAG TPA: TetR/AcrR family transcriptional regulator [Melioribacteraceae bacterium]|nr:TetR/AcrR family transcriptional regulator [Melioribacteraceae bacterium]